MNLSKSLALACAVALAPSLALANTLPPIQPVEHVDLPRFMGDWYVIATIPTRFEKNAYNALEVYTLKPNGDVATSFHYREGSFDGEKKDIRSTGIVKNGTGNAVWGVQVVWPLKAQYIVAYLKDDYSQVIVARDARDYTWVMARTPTVSQSDYVALMAKVKALGYPLAKVRKVPQAETQAKP
ncbi:MAG: lipocalin family protein [Rhodanobacter sp.]